MNCEMWANPVVKENLGRLQTRGLLVLEPEIGPLACGAAGAGRLPEIDNIIEVLARMVSQPDLAGRRVMVTAGPTHEDLDPVRFLTNRSSGKMGYALARMAWRRGAAVCLVSGPSALPTPYGVELVRVRSAEEMLAALRLRFPAADALLMAAAVSDYRPVHTAVHKIKRGPESQKFELRQNPDILKSLGQLKENQVMVGFAAETQDLEAAGRGKLQVKDLDLIVVNDVNRLDSGFAVDTNEVMLISRQGQPQRLPLMTKEEVADHILDWLAQAVSGKR
jgi:phosphopantothenoylcysteine decarboxylase/phosphopantothenate--cysteine ligase